MPFVTDWCVCVCVLAFKGYLWMAEARKSLGLQRVSPTQFPPTMTALKLITYRAWVSFGFPACLAYICIGFFCFLAFVCVLITFMLLDAFASCCIVQQWGTGRRVCGSRRINYAASCSAHSRQSESRRLEAASPNTTVNQLQQQAAKATEKGSKIKAKANQAWQS